MCLMKYICTSYGPGKVKGFVMRTMIRDLEIEDEQ